MKNSNFILEHNGEYKFKLGDFEDGDNSKNRKT